LVEFSYSSGAYFSGTTASGLATHVFQLLSSSGTYGYTATFSTQPPYGMISSTASVVVLPRPTTLFAVAVTTYTQDAFLSSATLTDVLSGTVISGQTLQFAYSGVGQPGTTNSLGVGTTQYYAWGAPGTW
jgi:hypothetical protein